MSAAELAELRRLSARLGFADVSRPRISPVVVQQPAQAESLSLPSTEELLNVSLGVTEPSAITRSPSAAAATAAVSPFSSYPAVAAAPAIVAAAPSALAALPPAPAAAPCAHSALPPAPDAAASTLSALPPSPAATDASLSSPSSAAVAASPPARTPPARAALPLVREGTDIYSSGTRATAKAMAAMQERLRVVLTERDTLVADHALLQSKHADVSAKYKKLKASYDEEVDGARGAAANEVKEALSSSTAQRLALHKELDFVKDLAQAAESEKRAAQASVSFATAARPLRLSRPFAFLRARRLEAHGLLMPFAAGDSNGAAARRHALRCGDAYPRARAACHVRRAIGGGRPRQIS